MRSSTWRRPALIIAALLLVLAAAYTAYWHVMAQRLRDGLAPWAAAQRLQGYRIDWNHVEIGGFPTEFRFHFTGARLGAERPVPVLFTAPTLDAWAEPWNLNHWQFATDQGAQLGGPQDVPGFDVAALQGSVQLGPSNAFVVFDLAASGLQGAGPARGIDVARATAHIEVPTRAPKGHQATALDLEIQLSDLTLPGNVPSMGNRIAALSFAAQLKGALPPGALPQALPQWRDDGGTVEVKSFRLEWGSLLIDANGTLALDSDLQPEGAFSAVITGQDAAVDLAVKSGTITQASGAVAKIVLGLLAQPDTKGDKAITVPLTVQQSRIFLGPAAIGEVPPIHWE